MSGDITKLRDYEFIRQIFTYAYSGASSSDYILAQNIIDVIQNKGKEYNVNISINFFLIYHIFQLYYEVLIINRDQYIDLQYYNELIIKSLNKKISYDIAYQLVDDILTEVFRIKK